MWATAELRMKLLQNWERDYCRTENEAVAELRLTLLQNLEWGYCRTRTKVSVCKRWMYELQSFCATGFIKVMTKMVYQISFLLFPLWDSKPPVHLTTWSWETGWQIHTSVLTKPLFHLKGLLTWWRVAAFQRGDLSGDGNPSYSCCFLTSNGGLLFTTLHCQWWAVADVSGSVQPWILGQWLRGNWGALWKLHCFLKSSLFFTKTVRSLCEQWTFPSPTC